MVTPGSQDTDAQLRQLQLPESLAGLTVLDIGCSDGFFSFECEKRGAARVLAVDNFSSVYVDTPSGFNVARKLLGSKVEFLQADLFDLNPAAIGQFDLVLFLGVLYHLRHPLLALERIAALCRRQLIMETEVAEPPTGRRFRLFASLTGYQPSQSWMEFYLGDDINRDPTTWWAPTARCAEEMLRSCGFCGVKTLANEFRRGMFHAFSPAVGDDVEALVRTFGASLVASISAQMVGRTVTDREVTGLLRTLSIVEFGHVRQAVAEARSKQWHQVERFQA